LLLAVVVHAQPAAKNWAFGNKGGLTFTPTPVAFTSAINTLEGSASISDQSGNLLFYTDGSKVWNKNNAVMPNGTGLAGGSSATQSALIVPWPNTDCQKYIIFTMEEQENPKITNQTLRYSVVDMSLAGGLGDVIMKNTVLQPNVAEKLTAIANANGTDYIVMAHGFTKVTSAANSEYYAFHVTAAGVNPTPVVSTGFVHKQGTGGSGPGVASAGQMKISPDGTQIAAAVNTNFVEIWQFNTSTGQVSPPSKQIMATVAPFNDSSVYGLEFSPDSKLLYVSTIRAPSELFQFVISNLNSTSLGTGATSGYDIGELQLGPDQKVYVARNGQPRIDVVNFPNVIGPGAQFGNGPTLASGSSSLLGLPTTIVGSFSCALQPGCPIGQTPVVINGVTYCCDVTPTTTKFCCTKKCPPGSVETTVNGVTFCCTIDPATGQLCCTKK
jgi:hypothetical protein